MSTAKDFFKKRIISKKHVTIDFKVRDSQEEMRHREVNRKIMIRVGKKKIWKLKKHKGPKKQSVLYYKLQK